ncbi:MAG: pentapeptide repeat-containing protein [Planctomycetales bacterium]|nr:pentapeptide repeat-containing protein [Planctomycetales bacterium]
MRSMIVLIAVFSTTVAPMYGQVYRWDNGEVIGGTEQLSVIPGANLSRLPLAYADFRNADLSGARFSESILVRANFQDADAADTSFQAANMLGANWENSRITGAMLAGTAGFTAENLYSTASYRERMLGEINLSGANLQSWDFSGQDLTGATFDSAKLSGAVFEDAVITGASFVMTSHQGFVPDQIYSTQSYRDHDLRSIVLHSNNLVGIDLSYQNLSYARLNEVSLRDSDFSGARLFAADLQASGMADSTLRGANLTGALLANTSFVRANLDHAVLASVFINGSLARASLRGANLMTADLSQANLTLAEFDGETVYNDDTLFPAEFDPVAAGLTHHDSIRGDYNGNLTIDAEDIDVLRLKVPRTGFRDSDPAGAFDLNEDGRLDIGDRQMWVTDIAQTWYGDTNLDRVFDSGDLIEALSSGLYEQSPRVTRAGWASGDWNGDGRFDSEDFVVAIADGGYDAGNRGAALDRAVPEPLTVWPLILGCALLGHEHRRRSGWSNRPSAIMRGFVSITR